MPNNNPTGRNQYSGKPGSNGSKQASGERNAPRPADQDQRNRAGERDRQAGQRTDTSGNRR